MIEAAQIYTVLVGLSSGIGVVCVLRSRLTPCGTVVSVGVDSSSDGGTTARQTGRKSRDSVKQSGRQSTASTKAGAARKKPGAYPMSLLWKT